MRQTSNRKLESYKIFPYVAWGLIVMFATFVYGMTKNLSSVAAEFDADVTFTEQTVNTPIEQVTNFEQ